MLTTAASLVPSDDEVTEKQASLTLVCAVQFVPKLIDVQIPLLYPTTANLTPSDDAAIDFQAAFATLVCCVQFPPELLEVQMLSPAMADSLVPSAEDATETQAAFGALD